LGRGSITVFGFPIFLATFMKKSLKISDTFLGSFTMSLFSLKVIELFVFTPLLDKKGFMQRNFVNKLKKKSVQKYFL
jgi:hypothetical protein